MIVSCFEFVFFVSCVLVVDLVFVGTCLSLSFAGLYLLLIGYILFVLVGFFCVCGCWLT